MLCSYLNPFEEKDLLVEKDFFKTYPSKGELHNIVIVGNTFKPPENDTAMVKVRYT